MIMVFEYNAAIMATRTSSSVLSSFSPLSLLVCLAAGRKPSSNQGMPTPTPPPPPTPSPSPDLMEELVEEILLRFPPHQPAGLFRACLVCKAWCGLISGARFRRRYREFHRTAPMLGALLLHSTLDGTSSCSWVSRSRFVPTAPFRSPHAETRRSWIAVDARHGRVLFRPVGEQEHGQGASGRGGGGGSLPLLVWDPITNGLRKVPMPLPRSISVWNPATKKQLKIPLRPPGSLSWTAAILCAAAGGGTCDHLDCHRGPFLVVLVGFDYTQVYVYTYSSDSDAATATWSHPMSAPRPVDGWVHPAMRSAFVGNALYFGFQMVGKILRYDLQLGRQISWIQLPAPCCYGRSSVLFTTTVEDGAALGFATIHHSNIYIWSRKDAPEVDDAGWTRTIAINLQSIMLPVDARLASPEPNCVVGFADGVGYIFFRANNVVYTLNLKTRKGTKVFEGTTTTYSVVPYVSFFTPDLGAALQVRGQVPVAQVHEKPEVLDQ